VAPCWPRLASAIDWIHHANGHAVFAHPDRYRLPPRQLETLLEAFAQAGGDAVEISGDGRFKSSAQIRMASRFGFALSSGSDFHAPGKNVVDVGDVTPVPHGVSAVWQRLRAA
jgi:predicted metal-dependent phosphoesterase TrpH